MDCRSLRLAEFAFNDLALFRAALAPTAVCAAGTCGASLLLGVQLLADGVESVLHFVRQVFNLSGILALYRLAQFFQLGFNVLTLTGRDFVAQFTQRFLGLISQAVACVAGLGQLAAAAVFCLVLTSLLDHALDLILAEVG